MGQMTIVLAGLRSPSQNDYYSSPHWSARQRMAQQIHHAVHKRLEEMDIGPGETCRKRVSLHVICYFDKRPLDSSNIVVKIFEDALKGWLLVDDSPKWVDTVSGTSRIDRENPRTEIIITEVEEQP